MAKTFVFQVVLGATFLLASAAASAGQATSASDTEKGRWVNFTDAFTKASGKGNFRLALAVDPATGNLFVSRWFTGVWMSSDKARTFARVDGDRISGGGPFSCYAMLASPDGGKLAVFNMNNKPGPSGYSLDGGKTWAKVAPLPCTGTVQVYNGIGYWPCNRWTKDKKWSAVMVATKDKGKTWCECRACPRTGTHSLCGHIACVSCAP